MNKKKYLRKITATAIAILSCINIFSTSSTALSYSENEYICTSDCGAWIRSGPNSTDEKVTIVNTGDTVYLGSIINDWAQIFYTNNNRIYLGWTNLQNYKKISQLNSEQNSTDNFENIEQKEQEHPPMPEIPEDTNTTIPEITPTEPNIEELPTPPMPSISEETPEEPPYLEVSKEIKNHIMNNTIYNYLITDFGFNKAAACAIIINIQAESGGNTTTSVIDTNGLISYGLCQWNGPRYENLKQFCSTRGLNISSLDAQMKFLKYELETTYKVQYNAMLHMENSANGCYNASYYWASMFEVCSSKYWTDRAEAAYQYYLTK